MAARRVSHGRRLATSATSRSTCGRPPFCGLPCGGSEFGRTEAAAINQAAQISASTTNPRPMPASAVGIACTCPGAAWTSRTMARGAPRRPLPPPSLESLAQQTWALPRLPATRQQAAGPRRLPTADAPPPRPARGAPRRRRMAPARPLPARRADTQAAGGRPVRWERPAAALAKPANRWETAAWRDRPLCVVPHYRQAAEQEPAGRLGGQVMAAADARQPSCRRSISLQSAPAVPTRPARRRVELALPQPGPVQRQVLRRRPAAGRDREGRAAPPRVPRECGQRPRHGGPTENSGRTRSGESPRH
jgi:hypothetical protein